MDNSRNTPATQLRSSEELNVDLTVIVMGLTPESQEAVAAARTIGFTTFSVNGEFVGFAYPEPEAGA